MIDQSDPYDFDGIRANLRSQCFTDRMVGVYGAIKASLMLQGDITPLLPDLAEVFKFENWEDVPKLRGGEDLRGLIGMFHRGSRSAENTTYDSPSGWMIAIHRNRESGDLRIEKDGLVIPAESRTVLAFLRTYPKFRGVNAADRGNSASYLEMVEVIRGCTSLHVLDAIADVLGKDTRVQELIHRVKEYGYFPTSLPALIERRKEELQREMTGEMLPPKIKSPADAKLAAEKPKIKR